MNRDTPEWLLAISLMSTETDSAIARRTGLTRELVRQERRRQGLAPFGRTSAVGRRRCARCTEEKSVTEFGTRNVRGKRYFANMCLRCDTQRQRDRKPTPCTEGQMEARKAARRERERERRAEGGKFPRVRARSVLKDAAKSDKRKGRVCDLTLAFVQNVIEAPCTYCGDCVAPRGLDRVDNTRGHVQDNVVAACRRCNMTRGDMPIEAWRYLAPGMRSAREAGVFGSWIGPNVGGSRKF